MCDGGLCVSVCDKEMITCNGTSVDKNSDLFNCGTCGKVCMDEYPTCFCGTCTTDACFPGDAIITLASGGAKRMFDLMLGDKVAVRGRDGSLAYEDVYAFGHRDALASASFVQLTVKPVSDRAAESRTLELTALHFVPVSAGSAGLLTYKRAQDVIVGDRMWGRRISGGGGDRHFPSAQARALQSLHSGRHHHRERRGGVHAQRVVSGRSV